MVQETAFLAVCIPEEEKRETADTRKDSKKPEYSTPAEGRRQCPTKDRAKRLNVGVNIRWQDYITAYRSEKRCHVKYAHLGRPSQTKCQSVQQTPTRYLGPSLMWFKDICQSRRANRHDSACTKRSLNVTRKIMYESQAYPMAWRHRKPITLLYH